MTALTRRLAERGLGRLTAEGRQAVQGHLAWLAQLEEAVSAGTGDSRQPINSGRSPRLT